MPPLPPRTLSALTLAATIALTLLPASTANPTETPANTPTAANAGTIEETTSRLIIDYTTNPGTETKEATAEAVLTNPNNTDGEQLTETVELVKDTTGGDETKAVIELSADLDSEQLKTAIKALEADPTIQTVEPDYLIRNATADLTSAANINAQWSHTDISVAAAWEQGITGRGQIIGINDTGYTNNADLTGTTVPGYDFISSAWIAGDGTARDSDPTDAAYNSGNHGQFVQGGPVNALANNIGVTGVAYGAKASHARTLGVNTDGWQSDIADANYWLGGGYVPGAPLNANPSTVVNMSMSWYSPTCPQILQDSINFLAARGIPVVVAAGNASDNAANYAPANCNGVINVGATNWDGTRASYSNYNADIYAPGTNVYSTVREGYGYNSGTSFAAPAVASVIALIQEANPDLTIPQIHSILTRTGDTKAGNRVVNAGAAVREAKNLAAPRVVRGIAGHYWANGGANRFGAPTANEYLSINGGVVQHFTAPYSIYWTPTYGTAHVFNRGDIGWKYRIAGAERGAWGYPVANESALSYGAQQPFVSGNYRTLALWSPSTGTKTLNGNGGIYWKWVTLGGADRIGFPTTNETGVPGGASTYFVNRNGDPTAIYWSVSTGAQSLNPRGALYWAWRDNGGVASLGFPIHDERIEADGKVHTRFSSGAHFTWTAKEKVRRVS